MVLGEESFSVCQKVPFTDGRVSASNSGVCDVKMWKVCFLWKLWLNAWTLRIALITTLYCFLHFRNLVPEWQCKNFQKLVGYAHLYEKF